VLKGNASISGVKNVDAFFAAAVNFSASANGIAGNIDKRLAKIRTSLELDADADAAEIVAAIRARYELEGDLRIAYKPAACAVSAQATLEAAARCDAEVDPGSASVECKGTCEVEASAEVSCTGGARVECVGTAPELECAGSCEGTCELTAAATCEGICNGTCEGTCSATDEEGNCRGRCEGECQGSCQLTAGGNCAGQCKGQCTYTPPSGECEATASVRCKAMANGSVECRGRCEGEVTPPMVKAECQASAKAEASLKLECTPPTIDVEYAFAASADAQVQAEFQAFLVGFRSNLSAILAELGRVDIVLAAGAELGEAGVEALDDAIRVTMDGEITAQVALGLGCALDQIGPTRTLVTNSTTRLTASADAAASLTAALGGGDT
jgi:modification target Cys-rich repeat protein